MKPSTSIVLLVFLISVGLAQQEWITPVSAANPKCLGTPDFTVEVFPSQQVDVQAGTSSFATVKLSSVGGFAGTVAGSVSPKKGPVYAAMTQSAVTLRCSTYDSFLIVFVTSLSTPLGPSLFTFNATGSSIQHSVTIWVNVVPAKGPDFAIYTDSVSLPTIKVLPGSSGNSTVKITSLNGLAGSLGIGVSSPSQGVSGSVAPSPASLGPGSTITGTVSVSAPVSQSFGPALVFVNATLGSTTHFTVFGARILPYFNMTLSPSPLTVPPGASSTATLTIKTNGFPYSLVLNVTKAPYGLTALLSPDNLAISRSNRVATATLTVSAITTVQKGNYGIQIIGRFVNASSTQKEAPQTLTLPVIVGSTSTPTQPSGGDGSGSSPLGESWLPSTVAIVAAVGVVTAVLYRKGFRPGRPTVKVTRSV